VRRACAAEVWHGGRVSDPGAERVDEARRRRVVGATTVVGVGVLGASLSTRPGSPAFYALTGATALTWTAGGLAAGPLHRGRTARQRRPVLGPVLTGVGAFGAFYGAALVARRIPVLDRAIAKVLRYADVGVDSGAGALVLATALTNGAAEELFFRGALYDAAGPRAVPVSTAAYVLATTATRNPALVLASVVMGVLFAWQRRATGGIQAPLLTHLTWSALMLRFLPPLFRR
jgi:uncharacterized protein